MTYWSRFPGCYHTGDYAMIDKDGYLWLLGRADDVLKIAGHRLGTMELESAFVSHGSIAEAAVTSKPDQIKGESIIAFVVPKEGVTKSPQLRNELVEHIKKTVGAIAVPEELYFVEKLPKTRSGKIMRRLLRDIAEGRALGDTTTLADPAVVASLKSKYEEQES